MDKNQILKELNKQKVYSLLTIAEAGIPIHPMVAFNFADSKQTHLTELLGNVENDHERNNLLIAYYEGVLDTCNAILQYE